MTSGKQQRVAWVPYCARHERTKVCAHIYMCAIPFPFSVAARLLHSRSRIYILVVVVISPQGDDTDDPHGAFFFAFPEADGWMDGWNLLMALRRSERVLASKSKVAVRWWSLLELGERCDLRLQSEIRVNVFEMTYICNVCVCVCVDCINMIFFRKLL